MVRTNDVDRAIREALTHRLDVLRAAQRGVHLVERIVGGGQLLGEQQVVRGHLGGNVYPLGLPPAHNVDRASGREVAHVQARPNVLG